MGYHEPRTTADEIADVRAALADARRALRDTQSHLDRIIANPDDAAGNAHAAKRNTEIVAASLAAAEQALPHQIQLTVVS